MDAPDRVGRDHPQEHSTAVTTDTTATKPQPHQPEDTEQIASSPGVPPRTILWIGIALIAAGLGAILVGSRMVSGKANVAEQLPIMVSTGLAGLALVILGAVVVDVAVRRRDSQERRQQLAQTTRAITELHEQWNETLRYFPEKEGGPLDADDLRTERAPA